MLGVAVAAGAEQVEGLEGCSTTGRWLTVVKDWPAGADS
jgi:hypothetical protein